MQDYILMVKAAAKQHRIELTDAEIVKFARDVPEVLALFSKLDEFNNSTTTTPMFISPTTLRKDEVQESAFNAFSNTRETLVEKDFFVTTRIKKQD